MESSLEEDLFINVSSFLTFSLSLFISESSVKTLSTSSFIIESKDSVLFFNSLSLFSTSLLRLPHAVKEKVPRIVR